MSGSNWRCVKRPRFACRESGEPWGDVIRCSPLVVRVFVDPNRGEPLIPVPFSGAQASAAFPEYAIQLPELGFGSFKVAYRSATSSGVVLKIITDAIDTESEDGDFALPDRLARELAVMERVNSPHVVKILRPPAIRQVGAASYVYYEEPFYSAGTLKDRLSSGPLPAETLRSLALGLLEGIRVLWDENGVVHRDIKPGNIVFADDGEPVLLDLGIALFTDMSDITDSGDTSPRTTLYAAPEQFGLKRDAQIDFRTDLFSIGISLWEASTGRHPFWEPGVDLSEYLDRVEALDPSGLEATPADAHLKAAIIRMLAMKPNRRFRSVSAAIAAVQGE